MKRTGKRILSPAAGVKRAACALIALVFVLALLPARARAEAIDDFQYVINDDTPPAGCSACVTIDRYTGSGSEVDIGAAFEGTGYAVTRIEGGTFWNNGTLQKVTAPDTVTSIGYAAFDTCGNLKTVSLPGAVSIGDDAFYNCKNLGTISIPNAETIGNNAFNGCRSLGAIDLPKATSIGYAAFNTCGNLKTVSLPGAVSIGDNAFYNCANLSTVSIPNAETIGEYAFVSCGLVSVTIPAGVTSIGESAFGGCGSLRTILIERGGKTLSIGADAFKGTYAILAGTGVTLSYTGTVPAGYHATFTVTPADAGYAVDGQTLRLGSGAVTLTAQVVQDAPVLTPTTITVTTQNITVGETETITVTLDPAIAGATVEVAVYSEKSSAPVTTDTVTTDSAGEAQKTLSGLTAGNYEVTAYYAGNDTYAESRGDKTFTVRPPAKYTLRFDPGEGSGSMAAVTVTELTEYEFPACGFQSPPQKVFDHWEMSGVDGIFKPTGTVTIVPNCAQNGVITVTAYWKDGDPETTYSFASAAGTYVKGSAGATFVIKGSPDDSQTYVNFDGVTVDGKAVPSGGYGTSKGSLKLTLKGSYLDTLAAGQHTLKVSFKDGGSAEARFTIKDPAAAAPDVPKTGDAARPGLWGFTGAAALIAAGACALALRKRKEERAGGGEG